MDKPSPPNLDYSLPEEVDLQVRDHLPELFDGTHHSMLYIGANYLRQHFLQEFVKNYDLVTILEIFEENIKYLKNQYHESNTKIIQGDVRDATKIFSEKFDVCFFWHGPEHLQKDETEKVLGMLEGITRNIIVLGMPHGHYEQGPEYGNDCESHLWDIYPADMQKLGYQVHALGDADDTLANMMAWKYVK